MDFILIFDRLFPGENVSPRCADGTYADIAATWRGSGPIPSEAECQTEWNAILAEMPELALTGEARVTAEEKKAAKQLMQLLKTPAGRALAAVTLRAFDENNTLRQWISDFKTATANAGTLAQFKTAVAALPNTPQRTKAQLWGALVADIDSEEKVDQ